MINFILYHQDGCGQCKMAEMLLQKEGIKYDSCKDIQTMKSLNINHTPVLEVRDVEKQSSSFLQGAKAIKDYLEHIKERV